MSDLSVTVYLRPEEEYQNLKVEVVRLQKEVNSLRAARAEALHFQIRLQDAKKYLKDHNLPYDWLN